MAHGPRYHVRFRRRREGRTDYKRRLALLRSGEHRAVVRRTNRSLSVQFVGYDAVGDEIVAQAEALELPELGWTGNTGNTPAAYLTGLLAGTRALEQGVESAVLDIGLQVPSRGGALFAALKGILDAGVEIPHGDGIFPSEERLQGAHIDEALVASFTATVEQITGETPEASADAADEPTDNPEEEA